MFRIRHGRSRSANIPNAGLAQESAGAPSSARQRSLNRVRRYDRPCLQHLPNRHGGTEPDAAATNLRVEHSVGLAAGRLRRGCPLGSARRRRGQALVAVAEQVVAPLGRRGPARGAGRVAMDDLPGWVGFVIAAGGMLLVLVYSLEMESGGLARTARLTPPRQRRSARSMACHSVAGPAIRVGLSIAIRMSSFRSTAARSASPVPMVPIPVSITPIALARPRRIAPPVRRQTGHGYVGPRNSIGRGILRAGVVDNAHACISTSCHRIPRSPRCRRSPHCHRPSFGGP